MHDQSQVIFQESPRDHRTEIPNIVLELLADGEINSCDFTLYCLYRKIAGQSGACWVGTRGLAELTGLNKDTITKSKLKLSKGFQKLNGISLIQITPGNKKLEEADIVTINDLWPINHQYFKNKLTCPKLRYTPVRKEGTPLSEIRVHKKEPFKKEPMKKEPSSSIDPYEIPDPPVKNDDALPAADDDACGAGDFSLKEILEENCRDVEVTKTNGQKLVMTQSVIYRHFSKLPYPTDVVRAAIERLRANSGNVNNILKYLESICQSILKEREKPKPAKKSFTETKKPEIAQTIEKKKTITLRDFIKAKVDRGEFVSQAELKMARLI